MEHLLWVQVVSVSLSLPLLWQTMRHLKLARILADTPTSSIAHAQQGMVEVKGRAFSKNQNTLYVPRLQVPCVWYCYRAIFEQSEHPKDDGIYLKESQQRIYIKDATGECAVDPLHAEIIPKKIRKQVEYGVTYELSWIGVEEYVCVIGWLDTLHPMPQTQDKLAHNARSANPHLPRRYGQLTQPEHLIKKPPHRGFPFVIGADIEPRLRRRYRQLAAWWFMGFCVIGFGLPLVLTFYG